ncbi:MAG TPA: hypothetical protein VFE67_18355 [Rudaea sp.]|nr:hypothetical protein [Rudaea sp.]
MHDRQLLVNLPLLNLRYPATARNSAFFLPVIPAEAGIQFFSTLQRRWIPASAGMTIFFVPALALFFLVIPAKAGIQLLSALRKGAGSRRSPG